MLELFPGRLRGARDRRRARARGLHERRGRGAALAGIRRRGRRPRWRRAGRSAGGSSTGRVRVGVALDRAAVGGTRRGRDRRRDRSGPRLRHRRARDHAALPAAAAARRAWQPPRRRLRLGRARDRRERSSASTRSSPSTSTRRPSRRPSATPLENDVVVDIRLADLREERLPDGRPRGREHRSRGRCRARRQADRAAALITSGYLVSRRPRAGRLPARGTAVATAAGRPICTSAA